MWAWRVAISVASPAIADLRVFIADEDLSLLLSYPVSAPALFGEGDVYEVSPLRNQGLISVALYDLGPTPDDCVSSGRFTIKNGGTASPKSPYREFKLPPTDARFDDVSVYHYLSRARAYFRNIFRSEIFEDPLFNPLTVIVHDPNSDENAYFHPDRGALTFGDFDSGQRSSARSYDMVLHEFAHAVTHSICRLNDSPAQQTKALSEGYSDYFACSAINDPRFGDYVTARPKGARNCSNPGRPKATGDLDKWEEHDLGEVWAAVLWELRESLGPSIVDALVAESLYFAQGLHTVEGGKTALLTADAIMFPTANGVGRHANAIENTYGKRFP
jgi:hypothetical protein